MGRPKLKIDTMWRISNVVNSEVIIIIAHCMSNCRHANGKLPLNISQTTNNGLQMIHFISATHYASTSDVPSLTPNTNLKTNALLDGCIVWNAHNTVLGAEALLIYIVPVCYVKKTP